MPSQVVVPSAARVANGTLAYPDNPGLLRGVVLQVTVTASAGTGSPTLDLYLQHSVDGKATWDDFIHFTQLTTTSQAYAQWLRDVTPTTPAHLQEDKAISAATVNQGPVGTDWRFAWVIAGTLPSFTFEVWAEHLHGPTE